jgi:hypothetical protein
MGVHAAVGDAGFFLLINISPVPVYLLPTHRPRTASP